MNVLKSPSDLRRCCSFYLSRFRGSFRWDIDTHRFISNFRWPSLVSFWHSCYPVVPPLTCHAWTTDDLLLAWVIAPAEIITETSLAFIVASASCTQARVTRCASGTETPVAVMVGVAMCCFLAGIAARWNGRGEADWWAMDELTFGKCEKVVNRVGITRCVNIVGDDFVASILWWRRIGNCPLSFTHRLDRGPD
jgi:hypothetical protein